MQIILLVLYSSAVDIQRIKKPHLLHSFGQKRELCSVNIFFMEANAFSTCSLNQ